MDANPDPFQAIDSAHPMSSFANADRDVRAQSGTLHATSVGQLQVGYEDPVLGYVELRAQSVGGSVHASLGTHSEMAGEALTGNLNDLSAWMDARHTPVDSLRVIALHETPGVIAHRSGLNGAADGFGGSGGGSMGNHGGQAFGGGSADRSQTGPDDRWGGTAGQGTSRAGGIPDLPLPVSVTGAFEGTAGFERDQGFPGEASSGIGGSISILA